MFVCFFFFQTKCIQYWPISENERLKFGDITVLTSKIDRFPDYTVREIDISKVLVYSVAE